MAKKYKGKVDGPFIPILLKVINSQAFMDLSPNAWKLFTCICLYRYENGKIGFSQRDGIKVGFKDKETTRRALKELQAKGFIEQTNEYIRGRKKTEWRITCYDDTREGFRTAPTHDYLNYPNITYKNEVVEAVVKKIENGGQKPPTQGDIRPP